jgi:hypothetical protein
LSWRYAISGDDTILVGAAEGCDLLMLILKNKINRSQPSAAPTGGFVVCFSGGVAGDFADALVQRFELAVRHFRSRYDLCRSCRRLRSFDVDLEKQDQKIAAFGSSYRGICGVFFRRGSR